MRSLNDIVLQIHMTYLSHKESVEWISSFKDEIAPLSEKDFQTLVEMLMGVSQAEQNNFSEALNNHNLPRRLQAKATNLATFNALIEQLKVEYTSWNG